MLWLQSCGGCAFFFFLEINILKENVLNNKAIYHLTKLRDQRSGPEGMLIHWLSNIIKVPGASIHLPCCYQCWLLRLRAIQQQGLRINSRYQQLKDEEEETSFHRARKPAPGSLHPHSTLRHWPMLYFTKCHWRINHWQGNGAITMGFDQSKQRIWTIHAT